jgi:predicted enzyme related to lactoylglutathione lyase
MLNLNSLTIGSTRLKVLTDFYQDVLQIEPTMQDDNGTGWMVGSVFFGILNHSEMEGKTKDPGRVMFNLETPEVKEEFDRIKAIEGAEVIKEPYQMEGMTMWIATLADPDGNYFQLMSPWEEPEK